MYISEEIRNKYPKLKKYYDSLDILIKNLTDRRIFKIEGEPSTTQRFKTYNQITLHKIVDYSTAICDNVNKSYYGVSFLMLRSIYENVAYSLDLGFSIKRLMKENKYYEIDEIVAKFYFGHKHVEGAPETTNIITILKKVNKKFKNYKRSYLFLSEFCHPNMMGMFHLYAELDVETGTTIIGHSSVMKPESLIGTIVVYMERVLSIYSKLINTFEKNYEYMTLHCKECSLKHMGEEHIIKFKEDWED